MKNFLRGRLIVVPAVATLGALYFIMHTVDGLLGLRRDDRTIRIDRPADASRSVRGWEANTYDICRACEFLAGVDLEL